MAYYYDPIIGQGAATSASTLAPACQNLTVKSVAAPAIGRALPDAELPMGTWFDEAYDLRELEGDALTTVVLSCVDAVEVRQRKRRPVDAENHYNITRSILANALRCYFHRDPPLVAFTSGAGQSYYKSAPAWLNGAAMRRTLGLLEKAGLVKVTTGRWRQASSTYAATPALLEIVAVLGITRNSLTAHRLRPQRLVRLYEQKSGNSPLMAFTATDETEYWAAQLTDYNAFIAKQNIVLALTAEEERQWVANWNAKRNGDGRATSLPKVIRPELIQTDLHRCFNNGWNEWFMEGGRLYGGWWINTPGDLRKKITINGQPVIEADYSGCQIRMLYHERGIDYEDDPYALNAMVAQAQEAGLPDDYYRDAVKAMMQALINGQGAHNRKPELAPLKDGYIYGPFEPSEVRGMIEEKHAAIADVFGTGDGLRLQRKDGDLALTIIVRLMQRGIAALPVHDSFLVTEEHRDSLIEEMTAAYREMFRGYNPKIKVNHLLVDMNRIPYHQNLI